MGSQLFCEKGDKILDTHLGSASSRIAACDLGFDFYSCELDPSMFLKQEKRYKDYLITNGNKLFVY